MSGTINPLYVHGPRSNSAAGYTYSPNIWISLTYSNATRTGNTVSVDISGELKSLYSGSTYGFEFSVYAMLSRTSGENASGMTWLFTKPSGTSSWSDGYRTFNETLTIDLSSYPSTSAVYLQLYFSGGCDNCCYNHLNPQGDPQTFVKKMTWELGNTIPVPSAGYTVKYIGIDGSTATSTETNQTKLPNSAPSASSKGITTPDEYPSGSGKYYKFTGWKLPSGYNWGDTLSGNVNIKSQWQRLYTVTYKGFNNVTSHTDTKQTKLPNSAPSASSKGISQTSVTPASPHNLTFDWAGWVLPSGYSWGDDLSGDVTVNSVWDIEPYTIPSSGVAITGALTYTAKFYGYEGNNSSYVPFTITTKESFRGTCSITMREQYRSGNPLPSKQTTVIRDAPNSSHITQKVGSPVRDSSDSNRWKPSSLTYADNAVVSLSPITGTITESLTGKTYHHDYTISYNNTIDVTKSGSYGASYHYLSYYVGNGNRRYHKLTDWSNGSSITCNRTNLTGETKSHWHAPQVWKYRNNRGKYSSSENGIDNQGWNWWKDVDPKKYNRSTQTWNTTNKHKYNSSTGEFENCDTDLNINR